MMEGPQFAYRAARRDGSVEAGVIEAASRDAAAAQLARRDLFVMTLRADHAARGRSQLSKADLALGLRMLSTLLESGLPISRALATLEEVAPGSWKAELPAVREAVRQGKSLSAAMRESPLGIPSLVIGIIQAGEAGSGVPGAARRACEMVESTVALQTAIRSALAYPIVLASAGMASLALLTGVVLPRFGSILSDLGQELPSSTRLVLQLADITKTGALPALTASVIAVIAWRVLTATERGRIWWHERLLSIPVVGTVRLTVATARTTATLSALLESGVPIAPALKQALPAIGDSAISARLGAARESIVSGGSIAQAFDKHACMSPTAISLVRTGEETGQLAPMLDRASRVETERASQLVGTAVRLLEPILILVFSIIVALVAAALLQAVYSIRPA